MSHRSDYLNVLPTELLTQVFDCLDFRDHPVVSTVCTRWYDILSDSRYIVRHRMRLEPNLLDESNFNNLKRYRCVTIRSDHFGEANQQQRLQQYLFNSEAVEMLEELEIVLSVTIWNSIFATDSDLNLPNLHTLHVSVPIESDVVAELNMNGRIIAPKLRTFYHKNNVISAPLELLSDQIDALVVDLGYSGTKSFLSVTLGLPFANLRSLTINSIHISYSETAHLHPAYRNVFNRLSHLRIDESVITFSPTYALIFQALKNLTSLEIYGQSMRQVVFSEINKLQQLKELVLMIRIKRSAGQKGLSLPNLAKLMTLPYSLVPLDSVPSLRSLTIANNAQYCELDHFYRPNYMKTQFRMIADQLESLKIIKLYLNEYYINQICGLNNLKSLKFKEVEADTPEMMKIFRSLKNLKYARFTDCSLADLVIYCEYDSNCGCARCIEGYCEPDSPDPDKPQTTDQSADFFAKLAEENDECAIVAEGGRVVDSFLSHLCKYRAMKAAREEWEQLELKMLSKENMHFVDLIIESYSNLL